MRKLNGHGARRQDWPLLLEIYVDQSLHTRFEWGTHDCVSFAINWLALVRQELHPREELGLDDYHDAASAMRMLAGRSLEMAVDEWGQLPRVPPAYAQRGDVVLVQILDRACLAVCVGDCAAGPGLHGLEVVPMTAASAAWQV